MVYQTVEPNAVVEAVSGIGCRLHYFIRPTGVLATGDNVIELEIIIIITTIIFMVLSSCSKHCQSSPGSRDECRNSARWLPTFGLSQTT